MNWRNESVSPLIMWRFSIQIRKPLPILSCLGNVCRMAMFQKRFGRSQFEPEFDRLWPISTKSVPQLCCSFSEKGEAGLPCPWLLVARKWTGERGKILNGHITFKIRGKYLTRLRTKYSTVILSTRHNKRPSCSHTRTLLKKMKIGLWKPKT